MGYLPQRRGEVKGGKAGGKKKLGAKDVGFVGASLARGKCGFGVGRLRGFYSEEEKNGRWGERVNVNS
jgi:hypothetical protein